MLQFTYNDLIKILIIIAIGLLIINQLIVFIFKAQLIADPCVTCQEQHPDWEIAIRGSCDRLAPINYSFQKFNSG